MTIQTLLHYLLVGFGVVVALLGLLGMLGFGPGESIIVLALLGLLDAGLRSTSRCSARR